MTTTTFTAEFAKKFKKDYSYKMGGTQTVIMPNGERFYFDDRDYYSGRGSKYNRSIKHDHIGDVIITDEQVAEMQAKIDEYEKHVAWVATQNAEKAAKIEAAKANGVYLIQNGYVELSDEESYTRTFDAERLANTLGISVEDANLLRSRGKTYVFAKSNDGNTYQLYHPNTQLNYLSIHVEVVTPEHIAQFNHEEWASAPFAHEVGQTENKNHFVC